jgi:hypothetical protein
VVRSAKISFVGRDIRPDELSAVASSFSRQQRHPWRIPTVGRDRWYDVCDLIEPDRKPVYAKERDIRGGTVKKKVPSHTIGQSKGQTKQTDDQMDDL